MYAYIFPTPRSVTLNANNAPPKFEVVTDSPGSFAIEATTENLLFDARNTSLRNPAGKPLNFYNSFLGIPGKGIPAKQLRTPPSKREFVSLPPAVWADFSKHDKIYYRVLATAIMIPGRSSANIFRSIEDKDFKNAPYIHILLNNTMPYYTRYSKPSTRQKTPRLMVSGNKLIKGKRSGPSQRTQKKPGIVLRGVNFSGLQYREPTWGTPEGNPSKRWWQATGITQARIQEIASWGANILRLPINQDWVLNGVRKMSAIDYLKDIDQIVDWAASAGMYTLLDLQVLDSHTYPKKNRTQPMPDNLSLLFWRILSGRYEKDPAVLYDLCNEPHKPKNNRKQIYETKQRGYWPPTGMGWIKLWHEWARQLEGVIHHANKDAVIFVSGIGGPCYAASLRNMPVPRKPLYMKNPRPISNAVYSCHIYYHANDDGDGVDDSQGNQIGTANASHWDHWFGFKSLREKHPIFLGELGAEPKDFNPNFDGLSPADKQKVINKMLKWGKNLFSYLNKLHKQTGNQWPGLAGWTSWSWGDNPYLVSRTKYKKGNYTYRRYDTVTVGKRQVHVPTEFGNLVKAELGKP